MVVESSSLNPSFPQEKARVNNAASKVSLRVIREKVFEGVKEWDKNSEFSQNDVIGGGILILVFSDFTGHI